MLVGFILEHIVTKVSVDGAKLFNLKPLKDEDGYIHLRYPPTLYILSFMTFLIFLFCVVCFFFLIKPNEFLLWLCTTFIFLFLSIYFFFLVKNIGYKFNNKEITRQGIFKKTSTIFWHDCGVKPLNRISQQIVLYDLNTTMRISQKLIGYNHLAFFIERKFNLSLRELGLNGFN